MRKRVVFIANSLDSAFKFQQVLAGLEVDVAAGSTIQLPNLLKPGTTVDLVVFEAVGQAIAHLDEVAQLVERRGFSFLVVVDGESLGKLALPRQIACDFVLANAGRAECAARIVRLLGGRPVSTQANIIEVDDMVVNLDTYQVTVSGKPIDFTYMEYALLAFFAHNPNRTYSRDALLQYVWGVDYFGGSRTVDVHVRRIRAKLGPHLAQHLETIRGVGYLWSS